MSTDPAEPRLSDQEIEARFAGIVADWEPAAAEPPAEPRTTESPADPPSSAAAPLSLSLPVWRGSSGPTIEEIEEAEEDEGFEPPPVELPPGEDLHYWGAVLGLVSGPLVLLWVVLGNPFYRTWWILGGLVLLVGGFVLMVLRGPARPDAQDEDSGARL